MGLPPLANNTANTSGKDLVKVPGSHPLPSSRVKIKKGKH